MPKGVPKNPPQPWPRDGWEYHDVSLTYAGDWAAPLNELGRLGWQVVAVLHDEDPESKDAEVRVLLMRPGGRRYRHTPQKAGPPPEPDDDDEHEEDSADA
jgi:hypothetical protein